MPCPPRMTMNFDAVEPEFGELEPILLQPKVPGKAFDPRATRMAIPQLKQSLCDDWEEIPTGEIIRGPQSATWGSDAMAGVINIIRKKDVASHYLAGNLEGGSFSTINASVDGGYTGEIFRISGGLAYFDSDGTNVSRQGNEKDEAE